MTGLYFGRGQARRRFCKKAWAALSRNGSFYPEDGSSWLCAAGCIICRRTAENEKRRKPLFSERLPPQFISSLSVNHPTPDREPFSGSFPFTRLLGFVLMVFVTISASGQSMRISFQSLYSGVPKIRDFLANSFVTRTCVSSTKRGADFLTFIVAVFMVNSFLACQPWR